MNKESMRRLFKSTWLVFFMLPLSFFAQSVSGVITESSNGMPIPGVNILVQGKTNGTTSDFDGNYTIGNLEEGDILSFSFVGFTTQEIPFTGQSTINVEMEENLAALDEVVVIGYGTVSSRDATGAVESVTSEEFNKGPLATVKRTYYGKIAGVSVTSGGGAPGEGQNIVIRGQGSLSLNSSPLLVVDGIPLDNNSVGGSRNALDFINPNDIESMTVLKDASSTAIYGSRAANGVILITTKQGKGNDFRFDYSGSTIISRPTEFVDVLSADQFRTLINEVGSAEAIARLGESNTNWQEEIYTEAVGYEHNLSTTGRIGDFMPMRASIGYTNRDGILRGDNFSRTTASINLRPNFLDGSLRVELNGRGMYTENTFANRDAIGSAVDFDPTQGIFDANSPFGGYFTWLNSDNVQNSLAPTNPLALINLRDDTAEVRRFIGNAKVDYDLFFFPELTATVNVGYDIANSHGRVFTSAQMPSSQLDWNGAYSNFINNADNKLFDAYLTYDNDAQIHSVNAVLGYSYQMFDNDNFSYDSEAEEEGNDFEFIDKWRSTLLSYFGRVNYNYKDLVSCHCNPSGRCFFKIKSQ
ncbi:SusC/RagA family TonB-linked outer membrane protein [Antarcticibacterium sp. 1MA-6-2]|uniref:SusC/RagA family TonB-linked outer membrane protein n=1 Tax=Antarcticibacterium sp. 1MA-6-2 TaxID=2908210 RepID=UPI002882DE54|nr:SusC/RagA family TonB-linked outer membrane protein [Antarcticibacterium sp. 1MA-6-2]